MFRQQTKDTINGWGQVFRFITPIMIVLIGYLGSMAVNDIKTSLSKLETHFTNHLSDHKNIEMLIEQRLTRIETLFKEQMRPRWCKCGGYILTLEQEEKNLPCDRCQKKELKEKHQIKEGTDD